MTDAPEPMGGASAAGATAWSDSRAGLSIPAAPVLGAPGALLVIISGPSGVGKDTIIEAMHDARSRDARDSAPGLGPAAPQQRVDQCPARVTGRRVDDEPGGFVDDEQVVVLVHGAQLDVRLGEAFGGFDGRYLEAQACTRTHDRIGLHGSAPRGQATGGDELLDVASREARYVCHITVDALWLGAVRNAEPAHLHWR